MTVNSESPAIKRGAENEIQIASPERRRWEGQMKNPGQTDDCAPPRGETTRSDVGDVETAGETTAAATISGPPDTRPVGAETLVKVEETPTRAESDND